MDIRQIKQVNPQNICYFAIDDKIKIARNNFRVYSSSKCNFITLQKRIKNEKLRNKVLNSSKVKLVKITEYIR